MINSHETTRIYDSQRLGENRGLRSRVTWIDPSRVTKFRYPDARGPGAASMSRSSLRGCDTDQGLGNNSKFIQTCTPFVQNTHAHTPEDDVVVLGRGVDEPQQRQQRPQRCLRRRRRREHGAHRPAAARRGAGGRGGDSDIDSEIRNATRKAGRRLGKRLENRN